MKFTRTTTALALTALLAAPAPAWALDSKDFAGATPEADTVVSCAWRTVSRKKVAAPALRSHRTGWSQHATAWKCSMSQVAACAPDKVMNSGYTR